MIPAVHKVMPEGVIELERRIDAPPEIVFTYFTDAERYRMWQGLEAELDPRPGGIFRVVQNEAGYVARGEYVEIDPPSRLVFSWGWEGIESLLPGQSTVEVVLTADGDGTIIRLRHSASPARGPASSTPTAGVSAWTTSSSWPRAGRFLIRLDLN